MKKYINTAIKHPLISGSTIVFVGGMGSNVLNFLFNLFMGRNLSIADYGTIVSLSSLFLLCALIAESFIPTVVRFAGEFFAKDDLPQAKNLFFKLLKISASIGFLFLILFIVFSNQLGTFFKVYDNNLIILSGFIVFFGFIGVINRAFLQAKLEFGYISLIGFVGSFLKLLVGVVLVLSGFKIFGAMWAYSLSFFIPYILTLIPLRKLITFKSAESSVELKKLFTYGAPAALALTSVTFFITTDVLLVKHFFNPHEAGVYAALSLVGKVIFYFSSPIGMVMFPLIVQKHARKEDYNNTFKLSIALVLLASLGITAFYFLFPVFTLHLFFKRDDYLVAANLLGLFGLFITSYSLLFILVNFFLSTKRTGVFFIVMIFAILQAILIWFNHSTFEEVVLISIFCTFTPFITLLIYYFLSYGKENK